MRWLLAAMALVACGGRAPAPTLVPDAAIDAAPDVVAIACRGPAAARLASASVPDGVCAWVWASGLSAPRGLAVAPGGDVLVVEKGAARVLALFDDDGDGQSGEGERAVLASAGGLNHGIALAGGYLYASSATTLYRWPYRDGQRTSLGTPEVVVAGMPDDGHLTRTPVIDAEGRLYLSVGSGTNVDPDSSRARVRRFSPSAPPPGGLPFEGGEVFADGLRNEVGMAFDGQGRLWGVENGSDDLARADLGGDIHQGNPGEEMNLFLEPGRFYGYPYCWTEGALASGRGTGSQWSYGGDEIHTDEWCRDPARNVPPRFVMPAHVAPLDLVFYDGAAFPAWRGDAMVTWHGSWDREPETGYKVVRVVLSGGDPVRVEPLLSYQGPGDRASDWPHRPVAVRQARGGELLVSSDASGVVLALGPSR